MRRGAFAIVGLLAACHASAHVPDLGTAPADLAIADGSTPFDLARGVDLAGADLMLPACAAPAGLTRGVAWVRSQPPLVAAIAINTGAPPLAAVNAYFDAFHANAVHLWQSGLPTELAGWNAAGHAGFRYIAWVKADGTSAANGLPLGGAPPLPGRIGYQIGDEPADMTTLATMLAAAHTIRTSDPDALTIINVNDGSGVDALRPIAVNSADVDVLSYDHYTYRRSAYAALSKVRDSALMAKKPYVRYARAWYATGETPSSTEADLRWDAFVGAVWGFSGLTWFVYQIDAGNADVVPLLFTTKGDYASATTAAYTTIAALNQQLIELGRTTALLRSIEVRYVSAIPLLNPGVAEWSPGAGGDPYLTKVGLPGGSDADLGFFRDDCDEPYVILQAARHPGAEFPNSGSDPEIIHLEFDFSSSTDPTLDPSALAALDLATGATKELVINSGAVDVTLPAGGVVLWKYKNGRPIVRQP